MKLLFNFKLRELLDKKGMSQKELALRTGLREATISELINDTRSAYNKKHVLKVCEVLHVTDITDILEIIVIDDKKE